MKRSASTTPSDEPLTGRCDQCGKRGPLLSGCACGGFIPAYIGLYENDEDDGDTGEDTNMETPMAAERSTATEKELEQRVLTLTQNARDAGRKLDEDGWEWEAQWRQLMQAIDNELTASGFQRPTNSGADSGGDAK